MFTLFDDFNGDHGATQFGPPYFGEATGANKFDELQRTPVDFVTFERFDVRHVACGR